MIEEMLVNSFFEAKVEQLFEVLSRLKAACEDAGVDYELIGGLAVYLHIDRIDPLAARLTRDVDVAVRRQDLWLQLPSLRWGGHVGRCRNTRSAERRSSRHERRKGAP